MTTCDHGGCFYVNRSTLNITNDDEEKLFFGALESEDPENPVDVAALANTSGASGGVVYATTNTVISVKNTVFAYNTAYSFGGAICANPNAGTCELTTENVQFIGNQVTRKNSENYGGGAVSAMAAATWTDTGSTFTGNSTQSFGGAVFASDTAAINLSGTAFTQNSATYDGGAIYAKGTATVTGSNATFNGNASRL